MQLFGVIAFAAVGLLFLKSGLEAIGEFRKRSNPEGQHGAALMLGCIYSAIGLAGLALAAIVAMN